MVYHYFKKKIKYFVFFLCLTPAQVAQTRHLEEIAKKYIGSKPECLVPAETRGELALRLNKSQNKGKNNARGNKTSPGQKNPHGLKNGKQGLTRFSDNQFSDRTNSERANSKKSKPFNKQKSNSKTSG